MSLERLTAQLLDGRTRLGSRLPGVLLALLALASSSCSLFGAAPCMRDDECGDLGCRAGFCVEVVPGVDAGRADHDGGSRDDDAGPVADDAGPVADAGAVTDDAGAGTDDAGAGTDDAGTVADAGEVADDAGAVADDAGAVADDAGAVTDDAGAVTDDAGVVTDDAGAVADDAGAVTDDAGAVTDDAGAVTDAGEPTDAGPPVDGGALLQLGGACGSDDGACETGHCVSGVCCDTRCDGPCEVCSAEGTCTATVGASCVAAFRCDDYLYGVATTLTNRCLAFAVQAVPPGTCASDRSCTPPDPTDCTLTPGDSLGSCDDVCLVGSAVCQRYAPRSQFQYLSWCFAGVPTSGCPANLCIDNDGTNGGLSTTYPQGCSVTGACAIDTSSGTSCGNYLCDTAQVGCRTSCTNGSTTECFGGQMCMMSECQ